MNEYLVSFELANKLREKCYYYEGRNIYDILKWLREEKDIFIGLESIGQKKYGCVIIKQKTGGLIAKWNWDKFQYANKNPLVGNTYEQAVIAGIKYVVDNLI